MAIGCSFVSKKVLIVLKMQWFGLKSFEKFADEHKNTYLCEVNRYRSLLYLYGLVLFDFYLDLKFMMERRIFTWWWRYSGSIKS